MSSINSQLAEKNISNNYLRTAQSNPSESDMNEQHPMCEPHQQHYSQPTMYYDVNDIEQREDFFFFAQWHKILTC